MQPKKVWRKEGECYSTSNLAPSFKSGCVRIFLWAAFSAYGRIPPIPVTGTQKKEQYKSILEVNFVPFSTVRYA